MAVDEDEVRRIALVRQTSLQRDHPGSYVSMTGEAVRALGHELSPVLAAHPGPVGEQ